MLPPPTPAQPLWAAWTVQSPNSAPPNSRRPPTHPTAKKHACSEILLFFIARLAQRPAHGGGCCVKGICCFCLCDAGSPVFVSPSTPAPSQDAVQVGPDCEGGGLKVVHKAALAQPRGLGGGPGQGPGTGGEGTPLLAPRRVGPERTAAKTQGQAYPGGCGLLRLNSRVGGGQTTQPWVSPGTVPPACLPRRHLSGAAAAAAPGPEQACGPACVWRPTQSWVSPGSSAFAIPSLVRKSYRLAVEEWKVGNQTGSALEGVLLLLWFSSSSSSSLSLLFCILLWFWFYFSSPFLSESIPSGTFLEWFFFPPRSCLIPLGIFCWGGWSRNGGGDPKCLFLKEGPPTPQVSSFWYFTIREVRG